MKNENNQNTAYDRKKQAVQILSGVLVGYGISCIGFIACALALRYTALSESSIPTLVTLICFISAVVAGFDSAKGAEGKGWLRGIIAGAVYAVILLIIGLWLTTGFKLDTRSVTLVLLSVASGGLGGIIGINFKKKSRFRR